MTIQYRSESPEQTEEIGAQVARQVEAGTVIALEGDLGAGKTAFARGFLRALGYEGRVTSPTFTIVNEYPECGVCHFDMYRILDEDALYDIGWDDYLDGERILLIEWSENIRYALPEHYVTITIRHEGGDCRSISIEGVETI
ncbi:MAG: tRNA (adenosine(37)-N6)-threonylcarbamoyltransferase complex ATPase subunit type 1 TsaE [Butyricicoccaceae bacterium]